MNERREQMTTWDCLLSNIFFCVLITVFTMTAGAVVPSVIPVGGMLADTDGQPLEGAYDVAFALYDVETGGTALWSESRTGDNAVTVENGMFTVYLGDVSGDLDFSALMSATGLWLGMTVGTDSEMNRIYLGTVPYAMEAQQCEALADPAAQDIATQTWVTAQEYLTSDTNTNAMTECTGVGVYLDGEGNCSSVAPTDLSGYATEAWVTGQLSGYATEAWVTGQLSGYMPQLDGTTCVYGIADIDEFGAITCADDAVAVHESTYGHLTPTQVTDLTDGSETALHAHADPSPIPSGAVMFFNLAECPDGWSLLAAAQGRYLVGMPSGGLLEATVGTALTDQEDRPTGEHAHDITDPGHGHGITDPGHNHSIDDSPLASSGGGLNVLEGSERTWNTNGDTTGITINSAITGITATDSTGVAGTNAPYLQLLVCQKD